MFLTFYLIAIVSWNRKSPEALVSLHHTIIDQQRVAGVPLIQLLTDGRGDWHLGVTSDFG